MTESTLQPVCQQCPWRTANQGKRTTVHFYTKANLTRLWNQVRKGGSAQSCHLTDPSHADHIKAGCSQGATPRECPGSVILVLREVDQMLDQDRTVTPESVDAYLAVRKRGVTKSGLNYWLIERYQFGHLPIIGRGKLPLVDVRHPDVGLPAYLEG